MQMIFQDPYASLNPRWKVRDIVAEPLREHAPGARPTRELQRARRRAAAVRSAWRAADMEKFPHQFSGGQRQRISIARALATQPEFLVCDEPTSALDVSVQAQVLNIMKDLQRQRGLTYLFISHNLAVVRHVSDEVGVMYLGRLVELADKATLFARAAPSVHAHAARRDPRHPHERPRAHAGAGRGAEPAAIRRRGCTFHPRCPHANERCRSERPALLAINGVPRRLPRGRGRADLTRRGVRALSRRQQALAAEQRRRLSRARGSATALAARPSPRRRAAALL